MKLVKCNVNELGINTYRKSCNQRLLDEFLESDMQCARVDGWSHVSAGSCASSIKRAILRYKYHGVKVVSKNGEVYLVRITEE